MLEDKLKEIIHECSQHVEVEQINRESNLIEDFGYGSMNFIQLVAEVELQFNIEVDEDDLLLDRLSNFGTLLQMIERKISHKV